MLSVRKLAFRFGLEVAIKTQYLINLNVFISEMNMTSQHQYDITNLPFIINKCTH